MVNLKFSLIAALLSLSLVSLSLINTALAEQPKQDKQACQVTIIHAGTVLTVPGKPPLKSQSLIVRDGVIQDVMPGFVQSGDKTVGECKAEVIDLSKQFVLPGLVDAHTHLTEQALGGHIAYTSEAELAVNGVVNARKTLAAGFTTVRDVGSLGKSIFVVRDAIKRGDVAGPTILAAGDSLSITGGHGDDVGINAPFLSSGLCDGAESCRRAVRLQIRRGADVIKLHATGGGGDEWGKKDSAPVFSDEEINAIVDTAHRLNRKVAAHAHGEAGIKQALRAGVDSIEHASYLDAEAIRLFKKQDAYLVTTLAVVDKIVKAVADGSSSIPAHVIKPFQDQYTNNVRKAYKAGVKIIPSSDSGVTEHGANAMDLVLLVKMGMTPMEVVKSTTMDAAELLGVAGKIGTLEPGKKADLIATEGDFLEDITELQRVQFVMREGKVFPSQVK